MRLKGIHVVINMNLGSKNPNRTVEGHGFGVVRYYLVEEANHRDELAPVQGVAHEHHSLASKSF